MPGFGLAIEARNTRPFSISMTTVTDSAGDFASAVSLPGPEFALSDSAALSFFFAVRRFDSEDDSRVDLPRDFAPRASLLLAAR